MALSVRSVRCTSQSILFFGFLFTSLASTFAGIHLSRYVNSLKDKNNFSSPNGLKLFWNYFCVGYPILIGLWSQLIGGIGASTSKLKHSPRKTLQIFAFFIFSLILLAAESGVTYDLTTNYLQRALKVRKSPFCNTIKIWWMNCHLNLAVIICLLILAAFKILLSFWSVICCCGSLCCRNQVEQEPEPDSDSENGEQQIARQPTAAQGVMTPGTMMVPVMYSSGQPVMPYRPVPTMQGNMQAMPNNAMPMTQIPYGSHPPHAGVPVFYNTAGQQ